MDNNFRIIAELLNYRLGYSLTDEQQSYADRHILPHLAYWHSNKKVVCMECGKTFAPFMPGETQIFEIPLPLPPVVKDGGTIVCPHCGAELVVKHCRKTTIDDYLTMAVEDTVNGLKVKRVFETYHYKSIRSERFFSEKKASWMEVMRIWTDPNNAENRLVATAGLSMMNYNQRSPWSNRTDVLIRRPSAPDTNRYFYEQNYAEVDTIPVGNEYHLDIDYQLDTLRAVLAVLKKRAVLRRCVERIFSTPMIETLVKAGRTNMAAYIANASFDVKHRYNGRRYICIRISDYVTAARICLRNDYHPEDLIVFFDYIDNLLYEGKDIHNAHYVCAPDLLAAHGRLLERQRIAHERELARQRAEREELERQRCEELARRDAVANEKYQRDKQMYLGIAFGEDKEHLQFHVLGSVDEFKDEGQHMHHCVYSCGYYRKADSLILSCRDKDDKRVATIEIDLRSMSIVQTRAACNAVPPQLALINKTIMQHMDEFRQAKAAQMALAAPTDDEDESEYCPAAI